MAALSEVGLVPRLDVLPLEEIERTYPVMEPPGMTPKYLNKVSLADAIGGHATSDRCDCREIAHNNGEMEKSV